MIGIVSIENVGLHYDFIYSIAIIRKILIILTPKLHDIYPKFLGIKRFNAIK